MTRYRIECQDCPFEGMTSEGRGHAEKIANMHRDPTDHCVTVERVDDE